MPESKPKPRPIDITEGKFDFPVKPNPFRVSPSVGEGPLFVVNNRTRLTAEVRFSRNLVLTPSGKPVGSLTIPPRKKSDLLVVNIMNIKERLGSYPYQVKLSDARGRILVEASGRSRPEVEIQK
jgi:hypothetical protein